MSETYITDLCIPFFQSKNEIETNCEDINNVIICSNESYLCQPKMNESLLPIFLYVKAEI